MKITYLGHAALLVEGGGRTLLMDPWLEDPAYLDSWWHYPPLALKLRNLPPIDYVYCSHDHPDHFDPKTLRQLPPETTFLVPEFTSGTLVRRYRALGFERFRMLPFGREVILDDGLRATCYRTNLVWEDSSLVIEADGVNVYNMNDCKLSEPILREIGERHPIEVAFLPFSGAIHYPTCYDLPEDHKRELCRKRRSRHLRTLARTTRALAPRRVVPFAGNFALFAPDQLWMNEVNNINTPAEAVAALDRECPDVEPLQMNPGDVFTPERGLQRLRPAPDWDRRIEEIRELALAQEDRIARLRASERPARPSLRADFERYFQKIAAQHEELPGRIDATVVFDVRGPRGGVWALRFDRSGLAVCDGDPAEWNLRITVEDRILQRLVDREVIWDEALISFRLRFAENPEFFNEPFWVMLYSPGPKFMEEYFTLERPPAPTAAS